MELNSFLRDIVVVFGAALAVIALSRTLRIPAIVGLLITGCIVGPYGAGLIHNPEHVELFAELGVVFLLFEIGLELSIKRLQSVWRFFLLGGAFQAASTIALTVGVSLLMKFSVEQSIFFGLILAMSSTAIVMSLYNARREMNSPHGSIALGILLFQDILIVPFILIVPLLGGSTNASVGQFLLRFVGGIAVLSAVFAVSRFIVPKALHYLASTRIRELLVIGSLFLCLGEALVTQRLGFSLALGAFLAGVLIAGSDYRNQVIAETSPFRDVFNSMFFISIGMLLKVDVVVQYPMSIALATVLILVLKGAALFLTVRILAYPPRVAATVALGLCQIGEFSFVLIQAGKMHGVVNEWIYQVAIASSIVTMAITPLLMYLAPKIAGKLRDRKQEEDQEAPPGLANHVIIVGFGLAGRHLAGVLKAASIPYVIVELNALTVKRSKAEGEPILYGDTSREGILEKCGIASARVIVFVISDPLALRRGVRLARQMNRDILIIVRTRTQAEIEEMRFCGADEVVSEEFETSIEIFTNVLRRLHIPGNIIRSQTRLLRLQDYRMLRVPSNKDSGLSEEITSALNVGTTDTFLLLPDHAAVGRTIVEIDLRKQTGATIIAVVRDEKPMTNPSPDLTIAAGDLMVLVGSHGEIDAAFHLLDRKSA